MDANADLCDQNLDRDEEKVGGSTWGTFRTREAAVAHAYATIRRKGFQPYECGVGVFLWQESTSSFVEDVVLGVYADAVVHQARWRAKDGSVLPSSMNKSGWVVRYNLTLRTARKSANSQFLHLPFPRHGQLSECDFYAPLMEKKAATRTRESSMQSGWRAQVVIGSGVLPVLSRAGKHGFAGVVFTSDRVVEGTLQYGGRLSTVKSPGNPLLCVFVRSVCVTGPCSLLTLPTLPRITHAHQHTSRPRQATFCQC